MSENTTSENVTVISITPVEMQIAGATVPAINLRELYVFLEVKYRFSDWIKERIEQYRFVENQDYTVARDKSRTAEKPKSGRPSIEYYGTINMAKELSMVERNDRGHEARKYFIACEKKVRDDDRRWANMTEIERLRETARLRLQLADEMESRQNLQTRIDDGALFDPILLITDTRETMRFKTLCEEYFPGFSTWVVEHFLLFVQHPKKEVIVRNRIPKRMFVDEGLEAAAARLWGECGKKMSTTGNRVLLTHKCLLGREALMRLDTAFDYWDWDGEPCEESSSNGDIEAVRALELTGPEA